MIMQYMQKTDMVIQNNSASICNLETQIGQFSNMLTERTTETLLNNIVINPKEHVKVITLRSGWTYDQPQIVNTERDAEAAENMESEMKEVKSEVKEAERDAIDYISLIETLERMPKYAKVFKDILSNKRKLEEHETVMLTEESSAILQKKLPPKKLGLGEAKPTTISLQSADRSIKYPKGLIEDVLVKIDKFIFPTDFIILDMEEDDEIPLIMG
ncbi:hypothetical protein F2P56_002352 [Juglans regia]|uniref:Uncharacterized protein n=1 Tax=Juglans regia TaxID=51240 RepID=A0A834D9I1_JUGRE|nr:hypothetical protein F2P56_002352 [Juglans regia]